MRFDAHREEVESLYVSSKYFKLNLIDVVK